MANRKKDMNTNRNIQVRMSEDMLALLHEVLSTESVILTVYIRQLIIKDLIARGKVDSDKLVNMAASLRKDNSESNIQKVPTV